MNTNKPEAPVTRQRWTEESVADYLTCVLCGSSLEFKHQISYVEGIACEEACCPSCRVRGRRKVHQLQ